MHKLNDSDIRRSLGPRSPILYISLPHTHTPRFQEPFSTQENEGSELQDKMRFFWDITSQLIQIKSPSSFQGSNKSRIAFLLLFNTFYYQGTKF